MHVSVPSSEQRLMRTGEISQRVVVSRPLPALQPGVLQTLKDKAAEMAPSSSTQVRPCCVSTCLGLAASACLLGVQPL